MISPDQPGQVLADGELNAGEVPTWTEDERRQRSLKPTGRRKWSGKLLLAQLVRPDGTTGWFVCRPHVECDACAARVDHDVCPVKMLFCPECSASIARRTAITTVCMACDRLLHPSQVETLPAPPEAP